MARYSESFPLIQRRMKVDAWPVSDRTAWAAASSAGGPLDDPGLAHRWAPQTKYARQNLWGNYLSCLVAADQFDPEEPVTARLTPERYTLFIAAMWKHLSASSIQQALLQFYLMVKAMMPERDWSWMKRHPLHPSRRQVAAARLPRKEFEPEDVLFKAVAAMEAIDAAPVRYRTSLRYRDLLMIAFDALHLVRKGNLVSMRIGANLLVYPHTLHVVFTAEEVKNYTPIDGPVAPLIEPSVRRYLNVHRPVLLKGNTHDALWVNMEGLPLSYMSTHRLFARGTKRLVGIALSPHCFRHGSVTSVLKRDPRAISQAAGMLSHKSTKTTRSYYDHSGPEGAQKIWRKQLRRLKRGI